MTKSKFAKLQEKLVIKQSSAWNNFNEKQRQTIFSFCEKYKEFLNEAKTEREATEVIIKCTDKNFIDFIRTKKSEYPNLQSIFSGTG